MDRSDNYEKLIDALFEGPASADEAERLLGGTSGSELEELAELAETLARIDPEMAAPSDAQFRATRQSVMATLSASAAPPQSRHLARWLPLAAALAAFAVGLAVGNGDTAPVAAPLTLTDLVSRSAAGTESDSNFRYSNLRVEAVDADTLALTVDVASELELRRPKDDFLVNEILANSLLNEESLGARLKAVRHAGDNPQIQRALTAVALSDPDMSVRLKALERLVERTPTSPATQATLLSVLENEESVVMRLIALDALSDDRIDSTLLDSLDKNMTPEGGDTVLWHAQQLLNQRSL